MSQRLYKLLSNRGIKKIRNLRNITKKDLLKSRGFGEGALNELEEIINKYKICLKE